MAKINRRELLQGTLAGGVLGLSACARDNPARDGWRRGTIRHLLPTASDRAFNIKLSLAAPLASPPVLRTGAREVEGSQQDTAGRFWAFRIAGLEPDTEYTLELRSGAGQLDPPLCDPWPLRTLPARESHPDGLRVISYTCAGGPNLPTPPSIFHAFKPTAYRQRLFDLILDREPDLVIANGDHVYFDLPSMNRLREGVAGNLLAKFIDGVNAIFDPELPVLGTPNEIAITTVGDDQIAGIYGVRFRSTPMFFVTDDHDYFDNDDATPERITMPPDAFHMALRNTLQRLYFPEFIVENDPGPALPGHSHEAGLALSTHFGEVRYGDLFGALFYDCSGYLSLQPEGGLLPASVENWLVQRTLSQQPTHLIHVPSHPVGWTAGKWREWYPDVLESSGSIVEAVGVDDEGNKYQWQRGWWEQHQRLLALLAAQADRIPLIVSGDLHALGIVRIDRSGDLDFAANPVYSVLSGPVGVGDLGWPSRARGVAAHTPRDMHVEELLGLEERNGFTVLDFAPHAVTVDILGCPEGWVSPAELEVKTAAHLELT